MIAIVLAAVLTASVLSGCTTGTGGNAVSSPAASAPAASSPAVSDQASAGPAIEQTSNGVILRGTSIEETKNFTLKEGPATVHVKLYSTSGGYTVNIYSHDRAIMDIIPDEMRKLHIYTGDPGQYEVTKTITVPATGSYYMYIVTSGKWEVTITQ